MNLLALPAFADNYIWMLHDGRQALVVDPGDAAPVHQALDVHGLALAAILVTHHHNDHVGGLAGLRERLQGPVFAPARETIPQPTVPVTGGDTVQALGCAFEVIDVPGHTAGHIAYVHRPAHGAPILFCGDTLFSGGCGRLFEGTPAQMHQSLTQLAQLPADTRVCCAHEYTLSNLKFARAVEPHNTDLLDYTSRCENLRSRGLPTLPGSIGQEQRINPFLRCGQPAVVEAARRHGAASGDAVEVLATLRQWKNVFQ
ncbi:hydroxyacylglutathione hydrolase [Rhizobacter sp. Root1221]|uniref:hydroxyacylglutathione hydrolase n=1 Tax=Rhizobacter sp. Root1221 TaxID=1736433 RepID=UPI0006F3DFF9|nr:hydroxyacylglutathione hydrolase [Rhizobacter sp. Root1221]KQW00584.1 hydroxyacylglutathione hydrolase [Rhizobacter sp. Root1221]